MEYLAQPSFYPWIKSVHIIAAVILIGTGFGSAFFKYRVDRVGDLSAIVFALRTVVLVDWLFTAPGVILAPLTGCLMVQFAGYTFTDRWVFYGISLYLLIGLCWLPAVYLQVRMRDLAIQALRAGTSLPYLYHRLSRQWFWLGVGGFGASLILIQVMVLKPL